MGACLKWFVFTCIRRDFNILLVGGKWYEGLLVDVLTPLYSYEYIKCGFGKWSRVEVEGVSCYLRFGGKEKHAVKFWHHFKNRVNVHSFFDFLYCRFWSGKCGKWGQGIEGCNRVGWIFVSKENGCFFVLGHINCGFLLFSRAQIFSEWRSWWSKNEKVCQNFDFHHFHEVIWLNQSTYTFCIYTSIHCSLKAICNSAKLYVNI